MLASESSGFIADSIAQNSGIDFPDKAKMLCQLNSVRRLETAVQLLRREVEMLRLEGDIQEKTRAAIDQNQKDYFLREQMKAIREELGEEDDEDEFDTYAQSIQNLHLEAETEKKLLKDVERLEKQPFGSSEGAVLRNYLDTVLELPWNVKTKERVDVAAARKILEHDHFGLEKVKEQNLRNHRRPGNGAPDAAPDPVSGRPSRRGQDLHFLFHRPEPEPENGENFSGRHSRRGGHPRTPEDLRRRNARPYHDRHDAGGQHAIRCCCWTRSTNWAPTTAAIPAAALLEVLDAEQNHDYP